MTITQKILGNARSVGTRRGSTFGCRAGQEKIWSRSQRVEERHRWAGDCYQQGNNQPKDQFLENDAQLLRLAPSFLTTYSCEEVEGHKFFCSSFSPPEKQSKSWALRAIVESNLLRNWPEDFINFKSWALSILLYIYASKSFSKVQQGAPNCTTSNF